MRLRCSLRDCSGVFILATVYDRRTIGSGAGRGRMGLHRSWKRLSAVGAPCLWNSPIANGTSPAGAACSRFRLRDMALLRSSGHFLST
jgi:hypothetical protein